jgi:hypothetical protein
LGGTELRRHRGNGLTKETVNLFFVQSLDLVHSPTAATTEREKGREKQKQVLFLPCHLVLTHRFTIRSLLAGEVQGFTTHGEFIVTETIQKLNSGQ